MISFEFTCGDSGVMPNTLLDTDLRSSSPITASRFLETGLSDFVSITLNSRSDRSTLNQTSTCCPFFEKVRKHSGSVLSPSRDDNVSPRYFPVKTRGGTGSTTSQQSSARYTTRYALRAIFTRLSDSRDDFLDLPAKNVAVSFPKSPLIIPNSPRACIPDSCS